MRTEPVPPAPLRAAVARFGRIDTLLFTSRHAVEATFPSSRHRPLFPVHRSTEAIAIGPTTARFLRRHGIQPQWTGAEGGTDELVKRLGRGRRRRIAYPRSDLAGTRMARALRAHGHEVLDLVVYRLRPPTRLGPGALRRLVSADVWLVTSPSALTYLRRSLPPGPFERLRRRARLVVLGERSARAARGHGFRGVRVGPYGSEQGLTELLVAGSRHAAAN